jgi:hypothetical protein
VTLLALLLSPAFGAGPEPVRILDYRVFFDAQAAGFPSSASTAVVWDGRLLHVF